MNVYLVIHNIGFGLSAVASLITFLFLILNNPRAKGHIPLALTALSVTVFIVSHVLGVNVVDSETSRFFLMFNISMFFIGAFNVHAVLSLLNKDKERWYVIVFLYVLAVALSVWFIIKPELFLLASTAKMYFPNYYVPGIFNWVRLVFTDVICVPYIVNELYLSYKNSKVDSYRKQMKYFMVALVGAYSIGFFPNFLVHDIPIDPLWGMMFMVVFIIFFLFAAVRYELMNIKVIAKQAFAYGAIVSSIGGVVVLSEYLNLFFYSHYPNFPSWVIPVVSFVLVMSITFIVWKKIREVDLLKYEFITTVTHKFRTPLTQIRWASDNLVNIELPQDAKEQVGYIVSANSKLVELTNLLVTVSGNEGTIYEYHTERTDLKNIVNDTLSIVKTSLVSKNITTELDISEGVFVKCDSVRIKFVTQTIIENAVNYTPAGGVISVSLSKRDGKAVFSVKDSGIGIVKSELPFIFSKFYRGSNARVSDTEGLGIGLFISKEIINRHKGKIWIDSEGVGSGSTFSFTISALG